MKIWGGALQAGGTVSTKVLRQEQVWCVRGVSSKEVLGA